MKKITPLILTYNEEPNIHRVLERLTWAKDILVVDSYSSDRTLNILAQHPKVQVLQRQFDSFADQCNYGLTQITSEWVLSLDADYVLSDRLIQEIHSLPSNPHADSYRIPFKYCVFGKPLRGTLLPPRIALYRRAKAHYHNNGHAHGVTIQGTTATLKAHIHHDDRKSLSRWLWAQDRYMVQEAQQLLTTPPEKTERQRSPPPPQALRSLCSPSLLPHPQRRHPRRLAWHLLRLPANVS